MLVHIIDKKERTKYFLWYMGTTVILTALLTMILIMRRGIIGGDLLWINILLGIFGAAGLVITYLKGRDITMLQRAEKYKEYIAFWDFSSQEWKKHTGEEIPEDEKRFVMFMRNGVVVAKKLYSWNRMNMKLEAVEVVEKTAGQSVKLVCSTVTKNPETGEKVTVKDECFIPVPTGANPFQVVKRMKKENRLDG